MWLLLAASWLVSWPAAVCAAATAGAQLHVARGDATISSQTLAAASSGLELRATPFLHGRRSLQNSQPAFDPFAALPPCPELDRTLGPEIPPAKLGNFSQYPDVQQIRSCQDLLVKDGDELHDLLAQPTPLVKRMRLNPAEVVFTYTQPLMPWVNGSVNIIDCRGNWLDLTSLEEPTQAPAATVLFNRCKLLFPDLSVPFATEQWMLETSVHTPCQVRRPPAAPQPTCCDNT